MKIIYQFLFFLMIVGLGLANGQSCPSKSSTEVLRGVNPENGSQNLTIIFKNGSGSPENKFFLKDNSGQIKKKNYGPFSIDSLDFEYRKYDGVSNDTLLIKNVKKVYPLTLGVFNTNCQGRGKEMTWEE